MEILLGLLVIYTWVHGVVVVFQKIENLNAYEKFVLSFSLGFFVLYLIGNLS